MVRNGCQLLFGVPFNHDRILQIDVCQQTVQVIGPDLSRYGRWKFDGGVAIGHKIYFFPHNSQKVLCFDVATEEVMEIGADAFEEDDKWSGGGFCATN